MSKKKPAWSGGFAVFAVAKNNVAASRQSAAIFFQITAALCQEAAKDSFQPAVLSRPFQNLLGQCAGFLCAIGQNIVDVIQIRRQFGALFPRLGKIIPVILEQHLLQIAIPEATGAQAILKILPRIGWRDELEQLHGEGLDRESTRLNS